MNDLGKGPPAASGTGAWDTGSGSLDTIDTFTAVHHSPARVDALKLALGRGSYADDVAPEGMLHLALVLSPHAHACIRSIDTTAAEREPGVALVLHHGNVPRVPYTTAGQGHPEPSPYDTFMFDRKVRFVGDRVACVAADSPVRAARAAARIAVDYELLEPIFDPRQATRPGAPVIHAEPEATGICGFDKEHNIACQMQVEHGELSAAMSRAELVVEHEYAVPYQAHCCLEPHSALSWLDENNRLIVRVATQVPFHSRRILSRVLGIPIARIRVVKPRIGGGFGGKQEVLLEDLPAMVTLRTGQPARLVLSRREEMMASRTRHPQRLRWKTGVLRDGTLLAQSLEVLANTGAYGAHALTVQTCTAGKTLPLYRAEAYRFDMKTVYTNLPVAGAFRGYGGPQGFFALEAHMDEVAARLGMDPIAFRQKNLIGPGHDNTLARALGEGKEGPPQRVRSCAISECIERGRAAIGWERRPSLPREGVLRRGMGMSCLMHGSGIAGVDMGSARIKLNEDGSFNLHVGATDIGTGSDTILSQIAAETLAVPIDKIVIYSSDTDHTPFDTGAYASSTTFITGNAVKKACEGVRAQLIDAAWEMWRHAGERCDRDALGVEAGAVVRPDGARLGYDAICLSTFYEHDQHQIMDHGSHMSFECPPPFSAHFAEVEVDTETGAVKILRYLAAVDCGVAIHPQSCEGQTEGGACTMIGYALSEQFVFDQAGRLLSDDFGHYKQPSALDMPPFETILVRSFEPAGPYGAKSVSEIPADGPGPTLANAIADAIGIRFRELPITPEKIRLAWLDRQAAGEAAP